MLRPRGSAPIRPEGRPARRPRETLAGRSQGADIGLIKEGYLADLILVNGDPVKDIAVLQDAGRLSAIMKDGAFHKAPSGAPAAGSVAA